MFSKNKQWNFALFKNHYEFLDLNIFKAFQSFVIIVLIETKIVPIFGWG